MYFSQKTLVSTWFQEFSIARQWKILQRAKIGFDDPFAQEITKNGDRIF